MKQGRSVPQGEFNSTLHAQNTLHLCFLFHSIKLFLAQFPDTFRSAYHIFFNQKSRYKLLCFILFVTFPVDILNLFSELPNRLVLVCAYVFKYNMSQLSNSIAKQVFLSTFAPQAPVHNLFQGNVLR